MNEPSTDKSQNWAVRFTSGDFTKSSANKLNKLKIKYKR